MDAQELNNSFKIVFEKEIQDLERGQQTFTVSESRGERVILYQHAETLIQLYLTIRNNQKLKTLFIDRLKEEIVESDEPLFVGKGTYLGVASLCFYTLANIGYINEAISSLKKRKKGCDGLFNLILQMLPKNYFDISQLRDISLKTKEMEKKKDWWDSVKVGHILDAQIVNLRYDILRRQISKINVEINEDKKSVSEKIGRLGFNESYNELLKGIDSFINADTEKFINAGMISNLRAFMADLLKDVANRIAEKEHETIAVTVDRKEMGRVREYLRMKLNLSGNDDRFIDAFVNILHAEGGHAFMSEKEYFRLARNIAIEIALFILSKYEKKYAQ